MKNLSDCYFHRFVIFKTPIDNSSWSAEDVLRNCPEMSDQKSGCLIINIKPNRDAIIWYDINKSYLDIADMNPNYQARIHFFKPNSRVTFFAGIMKIHLLKKVYSMVTCSYEELLESLPILL